MSIKIVLLLAIVPLCLCSPTSPMRTFRDPPEHIKRMVASLMGTCPAALDCMRDVQKESEQVMKSYSRGGKLMQDGAENEFVDDLCKVAVKRAECMESCPDTPADGSLVALGNDLDQFMCTDRKQDIKEAITCFKQVMKSEDGLQNLEAPQCSPCKEQFMELRQLPSQLQEETYWESKSLKDVVGMVNGNDGPIGKACGLLHCALGCMEHVSEAQCGDPKHGRVIRDMATMINEFSNSMTTELNLDCLVPETCKTMHQA